MENIADGIDLLFPFSRTFFLNVILCYMCGRKVIIEPLSAILRD